MFIWEFCLSTNKVHILLYFTAACLLLMPLSASARTLGINGLANLGYGAFDSRYGTAHDEADSFSQRYSLVAKKNGNIYNRRGGPYKITVTYDHLKYLTNINDTEYSPSLSLFGWDGDLRLRMPHLHGLNLHLYSNSRNDIKSVQPDIGVSNSLGFLSDLKISVNTKRNGFKAKLGVNGGPYYYLYHNNVKREVLDLPDEDYSRLGIAVQYGVNWLHVRRDVEKPGAVEKKTVILGNVGLPQDGQTSLNSTDYFTSRYWYRLTNWLEISTDLMIIDEVNNNVDISTKRATMALRGVTKRGNIGTHSVHERSDSKLESKRSLVLPFWAFYKISPGTSIGFINSYTDTKSEDLATTSVIRAKSLSDRLTLDSESDTLFLETGYALNKFAGYGREMESHSIYFDGYTRLKEKFDYGLSYRYDTGVSSGANNDSSTYNHSINGNLMYRLSQRTRLSLSQGYLLNYRGHDNQSEGINTTFNIDHNSPGGFSSSLKIARSNRTNEAGGDELNNTISGSLKNEINKKLKLSIQVMYQNNEIDKITGNKETESLVSRTDVRYRVARNLESNTILEASRSKAKGGSSSLFEVGEDLKYSYNRRGFNKRKLFDVVANIRHKKMKIRNSQSDQNWFQLGLNYYPTLPFSCGASYSSQSESDVVGKALHFAFRYPLLTFSGGYSQYLDGDRDGREDRYNIDFTKMF